MVAGGIAISAGTIGGLLNFLSQEGSPETKTQVSIGNLSETVYQLPDSFIKNLYIKDVLPLFASPPTQKKNFGDVSFEIAAPILSLAESEDLVRTNPVKGLSDSLVPYFDEKSEIKTIQSENIHIPLPGFIINSDGTFPQTMPIIDFLIGPHEKIANAVKPMIDTKILPARLINKASGDLEWIPSAVKVTQLKQASNIALKFIWIREMVQYMKNNHIPAKIPIANNGLESNHEVISQVLATLKEKNGRYVALFDLAANVLAYQAIKYSSSFRYIKTNQSFINLRDEDFQDEHSTLYASFEWALTSPDAKQFPHSGDLSSSI